MEIILFVAVSIYSIFLNLRLKDNQEEIIDLQINLEELEVKVYNKMMDIRKEIKQSIKTKKVEKSRRRSSKRSRKVSPTEIS